MPDTGWKFYFLPVRAHLNQVPFLVLIVKKKRGICVKSFGILEFDENQSGYKFGKKQLLLFLIGIIAFALIILLPIPGLELAGRRRSLSSFSACFAMQTAVCLIYLLHF